MTETRITVNKTIGENNMSEVVEDIRQFLESHDYDPDVATSYDADMNKDGVTKIKTRFTLDADLKVDDWRGVGGLSKILRGKLKGMGFMTHDLAFNISPNIAGKKK